MKVKRKANGQFKKTASKKVMTYKLVRKAGRMRRVKV